MISLRPLLDRPQLLGTERHISQGAFDIDAMKWDAAKNNLSGTYRIGPGQKWSLSIYVPKGYALATSEPKNLEVKQTESVLTLTPQIGNGAVKWSVTFKKT